MQVLYYACPYYSIESKKPTQSLRGKERIDAIFSDAFHTIFAEARKTVETSWVPRWKQSDRMVLPFSLFRCAGDMKATMRVMTDPKVVWRDESPRKNQLTKASLETDFKRLVSLSDRKRFPSWLPADSGLKRETTQKQYADRRSLLWDISYRSLS